MCRIHRAVTATLLVTVAAIWMGGCGETSDVLRKQGEAAFAHRDYATSQVKFDKLADKNPGDWQAQWYLGKIALAQGDADRARMHLEVAYTLRSKGVPVPEETQEIIDDLSQALLMQGDGVRCISLCDEAIRNFGTPRDYLRKGDLLRKMGDADAAVVAYLQAAKVDNYQDVTPLLRLSDLYKDAGARQKAVDALRVADYIAPKDERVISRIRDMGEVPGPTFGLPPAN